MTVGVLALQGSFNEHIAALKRLGVVGVEVRKAERAPPWLSLPGIITLCVGERDAAFEHPLLSINQNEEKKGVYTGENCGEETKGSYKTTFPKSVQFPALREFVKMGKPVWGTCAGLIFLADKAIGQKSGGQELIGGLDCTVHRNFFGSQLQSFESEVSVPEIAAIEGGPPSFRGVFIRAPGILEVGPEVQVLAEVAVQSDGTANFDSVVEISEENSGSEKKVIVAVKQGNLLATAFHPELTADIRWHSYFLKMVKETSDEASSSTSSATKIISLLPGPPKYDLPIYQQ